MDSGLRIGEVAASAGVNVQTLRFYERRGLLQEPPRRASGYREYPPETVQLVRFIKRAQGLGFSLEGVSELLALRDNRRASCSAVRAAATAKIADIEHKMKRLQAMLHALTRLVKSCDRNAPGSCPILESLDDVAPASSRGAGRSAS